MMANNGFDDLFGQGWKQFNEGVRYTWDQVNHGFIDETCMSAKERAEIEARFKALEAAVEELKNKESSTTGEFIEPVEDELRWETAWYSDGNNCYPLAWQFRDGKIYDDYDREVDETFLKEYGFKEKGRWVSEWKDL